MVQGLAILKEHTRSNNKGLLCVQLQEVEGH